MINCVINNNTWEAFKQEIGNYISNEKGLQASSTYLQPQISQEQLNQILPNTKTFFFLLRLPPTKQILKMAISKDT